MRAESAGLAHHANEQVLGAHVFMASANRFFRSIRSTRRPNQWKCRSGTRYLYVCEDGLVHYCSQQRGYPAGPLADYTVDHIRREFITEKSCAPRCTIACVHYTSYMDFWRAPQTIPSPQRPEASELVQLQTR